MRAYKCGITKTQFINELKKHQLADAFIKGTYLGDGLQDMKGCAVGCSLKSINRIKNINEKVDIHKRYETELGIPEWLARLEDTIFEGLPLEESKQWPVEFSMSIKVGVDLDQIKNKILYFIVNSTLSHFDHDKFPQVFQAVTAVCKLLKLKKPNKDKLNDAADAAAWAAADAADAAAEAADAAAWAARAAAWAAAEAANTAAWAARAAYYVSLSKEIIRLLKEM